MAFHTHSYIHANWPSNSTNYKINFTHVQMHAHISTIKIMLCVVYLSYPQKGFKFNKVSDMFQLSVLPKVVRVTEGWRGSTTESTIENNELLIVKGLKRRLNHKYLKFISVTSKAKKELPENCAGRCRCITESRVHAYSL